MAGGHLEQTKDKGQKFNWKEDQMIALKTLLPKILNQIQVMKAHRWKWKSQVKMIALKAQRSKKPNSVTKVVLIITLQSQKKEK